jgi:Tol biopolymer transport system component/predicted Ser/Thr protein kinase
MSPSPGSQLDHYEIIELIGKGGMGEVYRAKDTRLPREAAIKISAQQFSERFSREAKIIAALNHPNISTLYDIGPNYLVMELVEGPTLAERIKQGTLSLEEASTIAKQIADALDYAHEKGVVHRDLKPGNVKIRPDGLVKVLDFGLAKVGGTPVAPSDESPTITIGQTQAGMILGTAAYIAPEQAKGKEVDKRADIYAFGLVFYEMLSGVRPHQGDTVQETMASVLKDEPDLSKVPGQAHRLLKRCLEKDPQKRLRHIGDVMSLLDEQPSTVSGAEALAHGAPRLKPAQPRWLWPAIAVGVVVVAGAALAFWAPWRSQPNITPVRFEVAENDKMKFFAGGAMAVSPDGHWMVFPAISDDGNRRYWLRSLETVEARPLPGTEGAYVPAAWSWDGRYVVFTSSGDFKLKKIDIQGGPPQTLADLPNQINGAAWTRDGVILAGVAANGQPLFRVSASGGVATPATVLAPGESGHKYPQMLPDGRHFLYLRVSDDPNKMGIYVGSVDSKPEEQSQQRLFATNREAYYAAPANGGTGHLIFLRDSTLMTQPFDPGKLQLSGEPAAIAEGVDSYTGANYGLFSVSDTGALVYRAGAGSKLVTTWFDQNGNAAGALAEPGDYANPAVSPDGTRVAVSAGTEGSRKIWILDVGRNSATRFTFGPANDDNPVWSPDGRNVVFSSNRDRNLSNLYRDLKLYTKPADGSGEERLLTDLPGEPTSWSKDGRFLLFNSRSPKTGNDMWILPNPSNGGAKPVPLLATQFSEGNAQVSPDGRWIAYETNESSTSDIYVRPFSAEGNGGGAKWLVSKGVSGYPRWRSDSKQLLYANINLDLMAVDIDTTKGFQAGAPRRLFTAPPPLLDIGWSMTADAKRFLFITTPNGGRPAPFTVVLNWAAGLKK